MTSDEKSATQFDQIMIESSYPNLYQQANFASIKAQKVSLCLQKIYLGSLILGSMIGAITSLEIFGNNMWVYYAVTFFLVVGIIFFWIIRARRDDKVWFDGRAVAESVKSIAWRYMMKIPPFHEDDKSDREFIFQLREIREAREHLAKHFAATINADEFEITDFMRKKRLTTLEERRIYYFKNRLVNQRSWYSTKSKFNLNKSAQWFWVIVITQITAVGLSFAHMASGVLVVNGVPVIITFAAVFTAWAQMKRYDDLAQSYALAAQELGELESLANSQTRSEEFAQLIEQVENSISREHTMWCARRDVTLSVNGGSNAKAGV